MPNLWRELKSAASLALPKYKYGSTLEAGCESISSKCSSCCWGGVVTVAVDPIISLSPTFAILSDWIFETGGNNVFSHSSLCLRWNSLWPPEKKKKINKSILITATTSNNYFVIIIGYFVLVNKFFNRHHSGSVLVTHDRFVFYLIQSLLTKHKYNGVAIKNWSTFTNI